MHKPKLFLIVLDGWGYSIIHKGNAIWAAKTPNFDGLWNNYSHVLLNAFGANVGLPWGAIGSSEVGHTSIGTGKLIHQELSLIDKTIVSGEFFKNKELVKVITKTAKRKRDLHLIGLVSNGGVHSHMEHLYALIRMAKALKFEGGIYIHVITDGRDTASESAVQYINDLQKTIETIGSTAKIASVAGRFYTMDRDNRWDRTKKGYEAMTSRIERTAETPQKAVQISYSQGETDEFIKPTQIRLKGGSSGLLGLISKKAQSSSDEDFAFVKENDGVIMFNIRPDRMRQITEMFLFPRADVETKPIKGLEIVTLTTYNEYLPVKVAFPAEKAKLPLAMILSKHKLTQGHFAETEKYAHVTYFFNGGHAEPFPGEDWYLVPSPKVQTYDEAPEMSAKELTDKVLEVCKKDKLDFVMINYANVDMVGHSGKFQKVVEAAESIDKQLGRLLEAFGPESTFMVTADHGNGECMIHPETGEIDKKHTVNPVPFVIMNDKYKVKQVEGEMRQPTGILADIAPTVLEFFGISKPAEMNGVSLSSSLKEGIKGKK